jgi:predicted DNA-binding protein with PD1-like motif
MEYHVSEGKIYLRIDKGEALQKSIAKVCRDEKVKGATFSGIGACGEVSLQTYLPDKDDFLQHDYSGMLEMVSLSGNVSIDFDGSAFLHAHAVFSALDDGGHPTVFAGHLGEAIVSYTAEIAIEPMGFDLGRKIDSETGISVWKFDN